MEKARRKVQMFATEQEEGLRSYLAQKHNRAGHSGEKLVGGRIEAGLAKAGLSASCKNIIWRTVPEQSK
jgi:hypothetical protein